MASASADHVAAGLAAVRERIAAACARMSRDPGEVRLVAVSKNVAVPLLQAALDMGVQDLGENRVQEADAKRPQLHGELILHLIGHLQRNKAARAAALFDVVQSVDSVRIARALAEHRPQDRDPLALLLEVDFSGIPTRTGVAPDAASDLLRGIAGLPGVHPLGLMTIAPPGEDAEQARPHFARLRALRDRLQEECRWPLPELSMGMSGDFEVAVEEGATMVRVGRAIFGPVSL